MNWRQYGTWKLLIEYMTTKRFALSGGILLALVINIATYVYLNSLANTLGNTQLPVKYDAQGHPVLIGYVQDMFWMPGSGSILLAINTLLGLVLYRSQRMASYLLFVASIAIQILFLVAAISIIGLMQT